MLKATARRAGFASQRELTTKMIHLRTACYIVIDLFSGIRDSEMMSIAENCITRGKSKDGSTDVLWLHGMIYKTGLRPKKWLVPPIVEEAIDKLTRLTAPLRMKLQQEESELETRLDLSNTTEKKNLVKRLITVRRQKDKLFLSRSLDGVVSVHSRTSLRYDLRRFCAAQGIKGDDGQTYSLHSHQFRRTYARFMARAVLGDLLTLRDHFGHWSLDMTLTYCKGGADDYETDTELLQMITSEKLIYGKTRSWVAI